MQGVGNSSDGILVLGATNLPWALDSAIRRRYKNFFIILKNRFERRIYIPLPDTEARTFLIKHNLKKNKHTLTDQDIEKFAELTDGYSGSDMANLVKDAVYGPVRKCQTATYWAKIAEPDGSLKFMPLADKEV
jgi:vacuolar protein-sorting-associated protein 4